MTQRRPIDPADLTDAWPDDPANEELARTAADVFAAAPALPQIALDRIEVRMRAEIARVERYRRLRRLLIVGLGVVALVAIAWLAAGYLRNRPLPRGESGPASAPVQDRFRVTLPPTSPRAPDKPLVDPARDADLFRKGVKP